MTKYIRKFTILLLAVLLTGCVNYNVSTDIKDDGAIAFKLLMAINSSAMEGMEGAETMSAIDDETLNAFKAQGFTAVPYTDAEGYEGYTLTKNFNISDKSSDNPYELHIEKLFGQEGNFVEYDSKWYQLVNQSGNLSTYKATFIFDLSGEAESQEMQGMEAYFSSFKFAYQVTLPRTPISHNADKVEGNTLIWDVTMGEKQEINYEFTLGREGASSDTNTNNEEKKDMILYYVIGGVALTLIIVTAVILSKKKKGTPGTTQPASVASIEPIPENNINVVPVVPTAPITSEIPVEPAPIIPVPTVESVTPVVEKPLEMPSVQIPVESPVTPVPGTTTASSLETPAVQNPVETSNDENKSTGM